MKLLNIQIALFSKDNISRPDLVLNQINESMNKIFDEMPMIMDLPEGMPTNIPIAQVASKSKEYALSVARGRVDYYINPKLFKEESITPEEAYNNYKDLIEMYCKTVNKSIDIIRIGIIFNLFQKSDNNVQTIYNKYLKKAYSTSDKEVTVRLNKQIQLKNHIINNIIKIEAGELNISSYKEKGVFIQFDINNVPELSKELNCTNLNNIIRHAANKIKDANVKELL